MSVWHYNRLETFDEDMWLKHLKNAEVSHVFFHPKLLNVWLDTYETLRDIETIFVEATSDDGNVALMPLVLWKRNWKNAFIHTIIPIGYSDFDYHDPIFDRCPSEDSLYAYWEGLIDFLKQFNTDEILIDGIRTGIIDSKHQWQKGEICPNLDLEKINSDDDLFSFFSTKLRGDIRRQIRRLGEMGNLRFKEYVSGDEVPAEIWNQFMVAHSKKWPNAYKAPGFHKNLLKECSIDGPVHFSTLMVDDMPIAWHLGFEYNGVYYYYMPVGNPVYATQSPVKVHLFYLISRAIKKNIQIYDHLRGDETYKSGWSNGYTNVYSIKRNSRSFGSLVKHSILKLRN